MSVIYVQILETKGSAPRDAGTVMEVRTERTDGTIGGGALEHQAIATARTLMREKRDTLTQTIPLGPGLGQCCGGSVRLLFTRQPRIAEPDPSFRIDGPSPDSPVPLWLWGAGHVGRAVVDAAPARSFDVVWVDDARERFPRKSRIM
ncbi:XdhC family protein [Sulfitobacter aestuariivivens]|uniref:XdhC family protein n=1 Tax=Sulfitobacter aestuariivivens TaxID=2766981 RepID=UPI00361EC4A5